MDKTPNARLVTQQPLIWGTIEQVIQLNGIKGQRATAIYDKRFRNFHLSDQFQECGEASQSSNTKFTPELETTDEAEDFFSKRRTTKRENDCPTGPYWICPGTDHFGLEHWEQVKNKKGFVACIRCGEGVEWVRPDQVECFKTDGAVSVEGRLVQAQIKAVWIKALWCKQFGTQLTDGQAQPSSSTQMNQIAEEEVATESAVATDTASNATENARRKAKKKTKVQRKQLIQRQ